jgi:hypothetical protein
MEKHFLNDFVSGSSEFRSEPWYNSEGDCIIYQTANEAIVRDRIDGFLTIYRSAIDNRPIGFQLKSLRAIIRKYGFEGLAVMVKETGDQITSISVVALLLAAYEQGPLTLKRRRAYATVMSPYEHAPEIPLDELCAVPN